MLLHKDSLVGESLIIAYHALRCPGEKTVNKVCSQSYYQHADTSRASPEQFRRGSIYDRNNRQQIILITFTNRWRWVFDTPPVVFAYL